MSEQHQTAPRPPSKPPKQATRPSKNASSRLQGSKTASTDAICQQLKNMERAMAQQEARARRAGERRRREGAALRAELGDVDRLLAGLRGRHGALCRSIDEKKARRKTLQEAMDKALQAFDAIGGQQNEEILSLQRWRSRAVKKLSLTTQKKSLKPFSITSDAKVTFPSIHGGSRQNSQPQNSQQFDAVLPS